MAEPPVRAALDLLIQDAALDLFPEDAGDAAQRESRELELPAGSSDRFLDGPACRRLAVVDFHPGTGEPLPPPAAFVPAGSGLSGSYPYDGDPGSPATIAVNAFGTAFLTMRMFEGEEALGRPVTWAFDGEQLLLVPRAGTWDNALYDRSTRSLQFFSFRSEETGAIVHTALSRDIVAHECGHALLDAVAPSLYDSTTRESVAIHEAVADVVALLMALGSRRLREAVLERTGNSLATDSPFTGIAEEFGLALPGPGGVARQALRELRNDATLDELAGARPHVLSTLLSAIFYDVLEAVFTSEFEANRTGRGPDDEPLPDAAAANKALGTAAQILRRLLLRGIDYLPPGDLTFADVGRATLAADRAAHPDADAGPRQLERRAAFAADFVRRGLAATTDDLDSPAPRELDVDPAGLAELRDSDFLAYDYATRHRAVLGIPDGTPFAVLPRIDATKVVGPARDGRRPRQRELLLKIAWSDVEASAVPLAGARRRQVPTGATVALRWGDGRCLALVRSDVTAPRHREERDTLLRELDDDGALHRGGDGVTVSVAAGIARLSGTHRLLHLERW